MECELFYILKKFIENQNEINESVREDLAEQYNVNDAIYEELSDQDDVNEAIKDCLTVMTKRINDLENRLNKLEKEKRRNASNK